MARIFTVNYAHLRLMWIEVITFHNNILVNKITK